MLTTYRPVHLADVVAHAPSAQEEWWGHERYARLGIYAQESAGAAPRRMSARCVQAESMVHVRACELCLSICEGGASPPLAQLRSC
eukprot:scaffold4455_cov132-Isochrysis_galbana.AAC.9